VKRRGERLGIFFLHSIDWGRLGVDTPDATIVNDLATWAGAERFFDCDQSQIRLALLEDGPKRFLVAHRFMPWGTTSHPTSYNASLSKLSGKVRLFGLKDGSYAFSELTRSGGSVSILSEVHLASDGIDLPDMVVGETRVFSLIPH
jgi:hypothetical protein